MRIVNGGRHHNQSGGGSSPTAALPVWYLPDPEGYDERELTVVGQPSITAHSNGEEWLNAATGEVITPHWLPRGAVVHIDFDNSRFYWNGAVRSLSDLTDNGDGSYILNLAGSPISFASGAQVVVFDYTLNMSADRAGHLWAMTATPTNTALRVQPVATTPFLSAIGSYYATSGQTISLSLVSKNAESSTFPGIGRHRHMLRLKNGEQVALQPDNGDYRPAEGVRVTTTIPDVTRIGLGCGIVGSTGAAQARAQNITLHSFTLYNRDLSSAEREVVGQTGIARPIHIIGDSFMTLYQAQHRINRLVAENGGGYLGASSDTVGGTTLEDQAVRYATNNPKWRKSTLVIGEMGASLGMPAALATIRALMNNGGRLLVLEPAPNVGQITGSPDRVAWDLQRDEYAAAAGSAWVPTLEVAYSLADGSPEDASDVANGLWPRSLRLGPTDFHPGPLGDEMLANIIRNALIARGWL